ncbi:MAG: hypothetical protein ACI86M_002763 [Saprospiraceae bacterium]|jgi:hypothetical protein
MTILNILLCIGGLILLAIAGYYIYKIVKKVEYLTGMQQLDLKKKGFTEMPAVPFSIPETIKTIVQLGLRTEENKMAKYGLSNEYTLSDGKHSAYKFMYDNQSHDTSKEARDTLIKKLENIGKDEFDGKDIIDDLLKKAAYRATKNEGHNLMDQFIEKPHQFTMAWTNYYDVYKNSLLNEKTYSDILIDDDVATGQFWPMIAENGLAYNLLLLNKVKADEMEDLRVSFEMIGENIYWDKLQEKGRLYTIDLRIFENWSPQKVKGYDRWTPGSLILLEQDGKTKKLSPISIRISGHKGNKEAQIYDRHNCTPTAWIFALTAARCSVTVYGIWLGHVYHWHIVTAAMQMTMFENMDADHPIRLLLDPQSKSLIGFNDTLFLLWNQIGPPTSFNSPDLFLQLTNTFADNREFFDDDPNVALKKLGIDKKDFTYKEDWDRYPIVKDLLYFWKISGDFARSFTDATYAGDDDVSKDTQLQKWITASSDIDKGNVRGLPYMSSKRELNRVLTSLIYRVVAHGNSRQMSSLNDALCFVSNFPPCLQDTKVPSPQDDVPMEHLMRHLPNTGTIGEMLTFYYIFIYSAPKDQLMPLLGNDTSLYFEDPKDPRNLALIEFRNGVDEFLDGYMGGDNLMHQWPASIET